MICPSRLPSRDTQVRDTQARQTVKLCTVRGWLSACRRPGCGMRQRFAIIAFSPAPLQHAFAYTVRPISRLVLCLAVRVRVDPQGATQSIVDMSPTGVSSSRHLELEMADRQSNGPLLTTHTRSKRKHPQFSPQLQAHKLQAHNQVCKRSQQGAGRGLASWTHLGVRAAIHRHLNGVGGSRLPLITSMVGGARQSSPTIISPTILILAGGPELVDWARLGTPARGHHELHGLPAY